MPYVVTDNCLDCRFTDCVEVCPVDCFYADKTMLYIHPEECIDCGACEPACPVQAIYSLDDLPRGKAEWADINANRIAQGGLSNLTRSEAPLPTAQEKKRRLGL